MNRLLNDGLLVAAPDAGRGVRLSRLGRERLAAATTAHDDLLGHLLTLLGTTRPW